MSETPGMPEGDPGTTVSPESDPGADSPEGQAQATQDIKALGTQQIPSMPSDIHCLTIIGQVEGHVVLPSQNKTTKYEHLIPQLVAVEQNRDVRGLLVILNTVGGDVEAGLAIAELIRSLSKPSVSIVLGGGHSIGVPIAISCTHSFIAPTATMTIHPLRLTGMLIGVPQTYEYLDKMQDRVVKFVVDNSQVTEERFRELMFRTGELARDIGTVLVGDDAVKEGLIDETGGLGAAVRHLRQMMDSESNGGESC